MNKEQLRHIKDRVKATIKKMFEDDMAMDFKLAYLKEKIEIMKNKVIGLCNNNSKMAEGVMDLALKELLDELHNGKLKDMVKQISEKMTK